MQVNGLLFDLGGTLFSYAGRRTGSALIEAAGAMGVDAEPEVIGSAWRQANQQTMARYARLDYFLHRDLFQDTLAAFAAQFNRSLGPDVAEAFHATQRQQVVDHLPIREDCASTLAALKERGLYLSIVSNIDADYLEALIEKHRLDRWLDHWTSSEEARSCKPHSGIYHYSLDKAGLTTSEALFVGDSLHHDVAGAARVGLRSVRIVEEGIQTPLTSGLEVTAEPDYEVTTLEDLIDIVDRLNDQPTAGNS